MKISNSPFHLFLGLCCVGLARCGGQPSGDDEAADSVDETATETTAATDAEVGDSSSDSGGTSSPSTSTATATGSTDSGSTDADTESSATDTGVPDDLCTDPAALVNPSPGALGHSDVAHWKYDRGFVLTINFDDSTPGQAQLAMPMMIERGLTGTWFVNPGVDSYQAHVDAWEVVAPANFQELANHSMDHAGAVDYADAEYQIGEAAAIIRSAYPPDRSPMMGFNNGGGTTWNVSDAEYQQLLDQFHCDERLYSWGMTAATPGQKIYTDLVDYMQAEIPADHWTKLHFHGICDPADVVNCVCDTPGQNSTCREYGNGVNNGAVSANDFQHFLDQLVGDAFFTDQVWLAGYISVIKYAQAREVSEGVVAAASEAELDLCLVSALDPALYDEALTLMTTVPESWTGCTVSQAGEVGSCRLVGHTALFEARIAKGMIVLSPS